MRIVMRLTIVNIEGTKRGNASSTKKKKKKRKNNVRRTCASCCANFNTRKRTNRLQYSVCASARSYPQGIALQKLISIQTNHILT
jgi:hypothetical protein